MTHQRRLRHLWAEIAGLGQGHLQGRITDDEYLTRGAVLFARLRLLERP